MGLLKRAILYITRKWKKTVFISGILFSVSTLVLLGLAFLDAKEKEVVELRGATGVSFSVSRNTATGGWGSDSNGSYSTQEYLTKEMMEAISAVEGIKGYNSSIRTILCLSDMEGKWLEQLQPTGHAMVDCQFYSYGCINSEYDSLFLSGALRMYKGKAVDTSIHNGIIISKEIANKHNLSIGDTIQAINDPLSNDKTLVLQVVGLFETVADKTDERNSYNEASYYDYANYAFISEMAMRNLLENYADVGYASADFFVTDPEQLETIIKKVQNIENINWKNFTIEIKDEVYEQVAGSVADTDTLIFMFILIISGISIVIIVLILSIWIRNRKYEIGIFLAIGVSKRLILLQYILEMILVSVWVYPLSYLFSLIASRGAKSILKNTFSSIIVTPQHFAIVVLTGTGLLILATVIACIPVIRYKPKEILSQME
ncbi:ABC transporter permease [Petralouisia muris]|uniref:ABC transporter permease n=1 Tax=Petralouisia muris TaxID=3032872 RepID=A0AC61RRA9_9FIRM|nr:FtsX-like permease family protein [Petralouisia muris]TGY91108.1 ABC transporter permease [Petralouisia muris]